MRTTIPTKKKKSPKTLAKTIDRSEQRRWRNGERQYKQLTQWQK